jgi:hypothetical protein
MMKVASLEADIENALARLGVITFWLPFRLILTFG